MKAWRFYGFGDMRLDDVPAPKLRPGHVLVEPLCVQPSVTEALLAQGIPTLAYDRVKRRLETEAPVQLFGHEFCARIVDTRRTARGGAGQAAVRRLFAVRIRTQRSVPPGTGDRL
jgi:threonine dehydrogenase-like Zn-dependent dehydrogenase